jgi:hypothetical protein
MARTVVIPGESRDRFVALLESLESELLPENSVECALVENMAIARWHALRLLAMQNAGISDEIESRAAAAESDPNPPTNAASRALQAFCSMVDQTHAHDLLNRYQSRYDNQYHRAFARLMNIREKQKMSKRTQLSPDQSTR